MTAEDCFAIQNLVYAYCHRIDRGDFAGIGELFAHADIIVPAATAPVRGVQAIHDMYAQFTRRYPDGNTPKTAHVTSNLIIEADGTEAARSRPTSWCTRPPRRCRCSRSSAAATSTSSRV